jgi:hypothetical protein
VHGQRFISRDLSDIVSLFDLNVLRGSRAPIPDGKRIQLVQDAPSDCDVEDIFDIESGVITSSLPYASTQLDLGDLGLETGAYDGFMIDTERVLALKNVRVTIWCVVDG